MSLASYLSNLEYGGQSVLAGQADTAAPLQDLYGLMQQLSEGAFTDESGQTIGFADLDPNLQKALNKVFQKQGSGSLGTFASGLAKSVKKPGSQLSSEQLQSLLLRPELYQTQAPFVFGQLINEARKPGGYLSPVAQDLDFANFVRSIGGQQEAQDRETMAGLLQSGLTPDLARQRVAQDPYRALRDIQGTGLQLGQQQREREFGAMQELSNVVAQSGETEKQSLKELFQFLYGQDVTLESAALSAKATEQAGKSAGKGSAIGGLATGIGLAFAGGI